MSISGYVIGESSGGCLYLAGRTATNEQIVVQSLTDGDLESLLAAGYRHFGSYFFRPVCRECHRCLPLRIPLRGYRFPRSGRRLLNRGGRFLAALERPKPSREAFELYRRHKLRFAATPGSREERYEEFVESLFHPFPFSYQLSVYDDGKLIAVSHIDLTSRVISAVYCYYDDRYARESLGSFAIYKEIEIALKRGLDYLYLGYYIAENPHMSYKARFRPNEVLLEEGRWQGLLDMGGNFPDTIEELGEIEFIPKQRLKGGH